MSALDEPITIFPGQLVIVADDDGTRIEETIIPPGGRQAPPDQLALGAAPLID
jgi:hypothetical protein